VAVSLSIISLNLNGTTQAQHNIIYYLIDKALDLGIIAVASETICCLKS